MWSLETTIGLNEVCVFGGLICFRPFPTVPRPYCEGDICRYNMTWGEGGGPEHVNLWHVECGWGCLEEYYEAIEDSGQN